MCNKKYNIWYTINWRELIWRNSKWQPIIKCLSCWNTSQQSVANMIRSKCKCFRYKDNIWEVINNRIIISKVPYTKWFHYKHKCIYCWEINMASLKWSSSCICRIKKKAFDNLCKKYSYISDCVPAQPIVHSFKKNVQAVTSYIEKNNIPDMKLSELVKLL